MDTVISIDGFDYQTHYNNPDSYGNPQQIIETGRSVSVSGAPISASRTTNYAYLTLTDPNKDVWMVHKVKNETIVNAGYTYATPSSPSVLSDRKIERSYSTTGAKIGLLHQTCDNGSLTSSCNSGVLTTFDYHQVLICTKT